MRCNCPSFQLGRFLFFLILVAHHVVVGNNNSASSSGLDLIGAGLGRTGTDSLRLALNELGYGPAYHMIEILGIPGRAVGNAYARKHVDRWPLVVESILQNRQNSTNINNGVFYDEWDDLFDGYKAAVDQPASLFAVELAKHYPNAKVILTVRSSPQQWHKSITKAWCRFAQEGSMENWLDQAFFKFRGSAFYALFSSFERRFRKVGLAMDAYVAHTLGGEFADTFSTARICRNEEYAVRYYTAWNQYIQDHITPAERLLVLETGEKDMAQKLIDFLGSPKSKMESFTYPRTNSDRDFANGPIFFTRLEAVLSVIVPLFLLLVIVFMAQRRRGSTSTQAASEGHQKAKKAN